MSLLSRFILLLLLVVIGGSVLFLATWDMPPPFTTIEKTIPADRMAR